MVALQNGGFGPLGLQPWGQLAVLWIRVRARSTIILWQIPTVGDADWTWFLCPQWVVTHRQGFGSLVGVAVLLQADLHGSKAMP